MHLVFPILPLRLCASARESMSEITRARFARDAATQREDRCLQQRSTISSHQRQSASISGSTSR